MNAATFYIQVSLSNIEDRIARKVQALYQTKSESKRQAIRIELFDLKIKRNNLLAKL